jgi:MoxR-like ATPase
MYIKIDHPNAETEHKILKLVRSEQLGTKEQDQSWQEFSKTVGKLEIEDILKARREVLSMHVSEQLEEYLVQLIVATREPHKYDSSLKDSILFGASPRATIALDKCAKINAWLDGRDFVTPEDVHAVIYEILRHRIILSFEAQAEGVTTDDVITSILKLVPLP